MSKKKTLNVALIILGAILIIGLGIYLIKKPKNTVETPTTSSKKKISRPVNIIPIAERPFVQLIPSSDGHYITINVLELKKPSSSVDYEMEYQTGSMLQGFQGTLDLARLPAADKKLFGSQSAGGAITYHEDIKGGTLLGEFEGSEGYAVKSSWSYFTNTDKATEFKSQDAKFTISNDSLANYQRLIVYNSPGFPGEISAEAKTDVYTLAADKSLKSISSLFTVSFMTDIETAQIMGYDGEEWQSLETTLKDGLATASGPYMEAYLVIQ